MLESLKKIFLESFIIDYHYGLWCCDNYYNLPFLVPRDLLKPQTH